LKPLNNYRLKPVGLVATESRLKKNRGVRHIDLKAKVTPAKS